jgi:Uri superfamily endonuclease
MPYPSKALTPQSVGAALKREGFGRSQSSGGRQSRRLHRHRAEAHRHRWYVDIRITLEDGTDVHKIYAATPDGIQEYESAEEWQRENW